MGPLHPLPVPDGRSSSIGIDFVGPLPLDAGFNALCTMTDRLGSDYWIMPTRTDIMAEDFTTLFFDHWYCENGLLDNIVCDRNIKFVSGFWKCFTKLAGILLKMLSSFHPETDGCSEKTNKTVNQAIRYHVCWNQKGWVWALPQIRFNIMNSVNASTGLSGFQLWMGRSPHTLPLIVLDAVPEELWGTPAAADAQEIIDRLKIDVKEAKDNLLQAKVFQSHYMNKHHGPEDIFVVGELVLISTLHRRSLYKKKGKMCVARFFPHFDGLFLVTATHTETSNYMINMPSSPGAFPTYHTSKLKCHVPNDPELFLSQELKKPRPIVTENGVKEFTIDCIIDSRHRGRGCQYLVHWAGYGPEHDWWLTRCDLADCEALDVWITNGSDTPSSWDIRLVCCCGFCFENMLVLNVGGWKPTGLLRPLHHRHIVVVICLQLSVVQIMCAAHYGFP